MWACGSDLIPSQKKNHLQSVFAFSPSCSWCASAWIALLNSLLSCSCCQEQRGEMPSGRGQSSQQELDCRGVGCDQEQHQGNHELHHQSGCRALEALGAGVCVVCVDGLNQYSSANAIEMDLYQLGFGHPSFRKLSCPLETSAYPFLKPPYQSFAFQTPFGSRVQPSLGDNEPRLEPRLPLAGGGGR